MLLPAAAAAATGVVSSAGAASESYVLLAPLLAWGVLAITAFGLTFSELRATRAPTVDLNAAALACTLATRVRLYATQLVVAASRNATLGQLAAAQAALGSAASELLVQHVALLNGDPSQGISSPAALSPAHEQLMYGQGCLRTVDPETCFGPNDPEHSRVTYGLNACLRFFVAAAQQLAQETPASLMDPTNPVLMNEEFRFVWMVGANDLRDGLFSSVKLYLADAQAPQAVANAIQIAVVPILFFGYIFVIDRFLRPWLTRTALEAKRVAELLARARAQPHAAAPALKP